MKRIFTLMVLLTLCGCGYENTPMQAVVEKYQTTEVKAIPANVSNFIVRDTNGAVWYVETSVVDGLNTNRLYEHHCARNTLLFEGIKKVDKIKLEE